MAFSDHWMSSLGTRKCHWSGACFCQILIFESVCHGCAKRLVCKYRCITKSRLFFGGGPCQPKLPDTLLSGRFARYRWRSHRKPEHSAVTVWNFDLNCPQIDSAERGGSHHHHHHQQQQQPQPTTKAEGKAYLQWQSWYGEMPQFFDPLGALGILPIEPIAIMSFW